MGNSSSTNSANYEVIVKTSDRKGAGTDGNIFIAFLNKEKKRSKDYKLDVRFRDDFEPGHNDRFPIKNLVDFGEIVKIELWRDRWFFWDNWLVEWIIVTDKVNGKFYEFPINRWIKGGAKTRWSRYDCELPQNDSEHKQRKDELIQKRFVYRYWQKIPGLPVQARTLPSDEKYRPDKLKAFTTTARKLRLNSELISLTAKKFKTLEDIEAIYKYTFYRPTEEIETWDSDEVFGNRALNGCNPSQIKLCEQLPEGFYVTADMVEPFLEGLTLDDALVNKRIFIIDYHVMEGIDCMPCPFALYFVGNDKKLRPIAIQLQRASEDATDKPPVFLPNDPDYTWKLAKMWFSLADASYHQTATFCFTYNILESVTVTMHRHLSLSHPLHRLIAPHLQHVIATNSQIMNSLIEKCGPFETLFKMGREGAFQIARNDAKQRTVSTNEVLPNNLKARGVEDENILPNYHYRDDALLIWNAIYKYVAAVVNNYYKSNDVVENDFELYGFRSTLSKSVDTGGCDIPGICGEDGFETREQVIEVFTVIIFVSSVGCASSQHGIYERYAYPPAYPVFLNGEPPKDKSERSESDLVAALPEKSKVLEMLTVAKLWSLSSRSKLAEFDKQWLYSEECCEALQQFRKDLRIAANTIDERNASREFPYYSLHPDNIPNGISI
ncbi:arachidonate 5-lipoxygenase-like [Anneissia japonica]|uniref:arachidonate 5-lipoxygenase-like n=1 Tax=Anneissia japonica TaxID=1529436 RepID=UPI0014254FED|nr:arachidonate 5-lipoxygenase-like [Anneissia japonica]